VRRRLLLVVVATTSLVVVAFAVPLAALILSVAHDRALAAAERDVAALAPVLAVTVEPAAATAALQSTSTGADGRLAVWLPDGTRVGDATEDDEQALALARDRGLAFSQDREGARDLYPPVATGNQDVSVVRARVPDRLLNDGVTTAWAALAAVAVALVAAAVVIADRLARSVTRDASGLSATARERVADLSHRLRTPLTGLRLDAEASGDDTVVAGVDRLEAAVTDLIRSARRPLHPGPVAATCDLAAVARDRSRVWSALADDDGRQWTLSVETGPSQPGPVALSAQEAADAVDAVIGNVFAHTPEGSAYAVTVAPGPGAVDLHVDDAGGGIDDTEAVLARGATGAGSTGLGLDIARRAAETAGGALTIGRSPLGGARVTLHLPTDGGGG